MNFARIFGLFIFLIFLSSEARAIDDAPKTYSCGISLKELNEIIAQVRQNKNYLISLDSCKKSNHTLFSKLVDIDYNYFDYASDALKDEESYVRSLIIKYPEIFQYISSDLKNDQLFVMSVVRSYPQIMQYVSPALLNNKIFMTKMIRMHPNNFIYASDRLQNDPGLVLLAVKQNGKMLEYASDKMKNDKTIVDEAVSAYTRSIKFASKRLQEDPHIKEIAGKVNYDFLAGLEDFLTQNYGGLPVGPDGSRGYRIVNFGNFFSDYQMVDRPYDIKWEVVRDQKGKETEEYQLDTTRQKETGWVDDFNDYPGLASKVREVLKVNGLLDDNTIDALSLTSLWELNDDLNAVAFDLYLLRDTRDQYLEANFANVVNLSAIARKIDDKWVITIVNALFDADIKMDISYLKGHKSYVVWDLYKVDKDDKNLKVLYKIEGSDAESFEMFMEQPSGKFSSVYKGGGYDIDLY